MSNAVQTPSRPPLLHYSLCGNCRQKLPLRPALPEEKSARWVCTGCQAQIRGVFVDFAPAELAKHVQRLGDETDSSQGIRSPVRTDGTKTGPARKALPSRRVLDRSRDQTTVTRYLDNVLANPRNLQVRTQGPPILAEVVDHGSEPYDEQMVEVLVDLRSEALGQLESLVQSLERGNSDEVQGLHDLTRETITKGVQDLDLFVRLGINLPEGVYPVNHSLAVAMLACSIAIRVGWDEANVQDIGIGCLIHDLGMIQVPEEVYRSESIIDDQTFEAISRHPFHTFDLLEENLESVPSISRMVAYQIHERCNGEGYPRRRTKQSIHAAAHVASIADVYVALVSPRPHRPALMPYHAILHLLDGVKKGLFEATYVRALLETISLFPIGSHVELSDGRVGTVLRANQGEYDRPQIEIVDPESHGKKEIVNLLAEPHLTVRRPLESLEFAY